MASSGERSIRCSMLNSLTFFCSWPGLLYSTARVGGTNLHAIRVNCNICKSVSVSKCQNCFQRVSLYRNKIANYYNESSITIPNWLSHSFSILFSDPWPALACLLSTPYPTKRHGLMLTSSMNLHNTHGQSPYCFNGHQLPPPSHGHHLPQPPPVPPPTHGHHLPQPPPVPPPSHGHRMPPSHGGSPGGTLLQWSWMWPRLRLRRMKLRCPLLPGAFVS